MLKKTIQEYQQEFDKLDIVNQDAIYQKLAEQCIEDYPNEDLGYDRLGFILGEGLYAQDNIDSIVEKYYEKILKEIDKNSKWAITLSYLIESDFRSDVIVEEVYHLLKETTDYRFAWLKLADKFGVDYEKKAECLRNAFNLGIDAETIIRSFAYSDSNFNYPIEQISIEDFLTIELLVINNLHDKNEIYFLGENGVGKTVILQAIMLGLIVEPNEITILNKTKISDIQIESIDKFYNNDLLTSNIVNKFAYGISRFRTGQKTDKYGYATLFYRDAIFITPENWLKDVQRKDNMNISQIKLQSVLDLLTNVVNIDKEQNLTIEYDKLSDSFIFREKGTVTKFEHLADGYRSVLILLCDLLQRFIQNQPYINRIEDFGGVVLIDEIDMLLHPKWEYVIVNKLRKLFPKIQWFFTTHSPMLILGASEDSVFYKVYKENGKTQVSEQYTYKQISQLLANSIITSPLFDLEYSGMREQSLKELPEIDTSDTFLHSRIRRVIAEKSKTAKKTKPYISPETIDSWIAEALNELKGAER